MDYLIQTVLIKVARCQTDIYQCPMDPRSLPVMLLKRSRSKFIMKKKKSEIFFTTGFPAFMHGVIITNYELSITNYCDPRSRRLQDERYSAALYP